MLDRGIKNAVNKNGGCYLFDSVASLLWKYDYRMVNLECPVTDMKRAIPKGYSFRADAKAAEMLSRSGITHAGLANNHIDDQTIAGATDTYRNLIRANIAPVGVGWDTTPNCRPSEIAAGGRQMAIFAAIGLNLGRGAFRNLCHCHDSTLAATVALYKRSHPDAFTVCFIHWGPENRHTPSADQVKMAHALIDSGADLIIGHHPHVVQSIRYYKRRPILFSLGNLVFDQRDQEGKEGILAGVILDAAGATVRLHPYRITRGRPVLMRGAKLAAFRASLEKYSTEVTLTDADDGWTLREKSD